MERRKARHFGNEVPTNKDVAPTGAPSSSFARGATDDPSGAIAPREREPLFEI
jgi:hypothetical protein